MKRTRVPLKAGRVRVYSKDSSGIRYESGYLAKFQYVDRKRVVYFLVRNSEVFNKLGMRSRTPGRGEPSGGDYGVS